VCVCVCEREREREREVVYLCVAWLSHYCVFLFVCTFGEDGCESEFVVVFLQ
jgi:hypothetical protein